MQTTHYSDAHILIVDDETEDVALLTDLLRENGYAHVESTTDARRALPLFLASAPDLVLLDLKMRHLDGFEVMAQLASRIPDKDFLPILVLTANDTAMVKKRALAAGADDFVAKPFDTGEMLLRIRNLLERRFLQEQIRRQNEVLENRVRERTQELLEANEAVSKSNLELQDAQIETVERLAMAAEYRDDNTGSHVQRISENAARLAQAQGVPATQVELIRKAAALHDVGNVGVAEAILLKPNKLTPAEFEIMKSHTVIGARILSGSRHPLLQLAEVIALTHHECWDGSGYPGGLQGDAIPLGGCIVAIVDVFDALTHARPYKAAWALEDAVAEIKRQAGYQFDPSLVESFLCLPHAEMI
jgi:putative two-component system response regulator